MTTTEMREAIRTLHASGDLKVCDTDSCLFLTFITDRVVEAGLNSIRVGFAEPQIAKQLIKALSTQNYSYPKAIDWTV